jgi:hypothetical protein
MNALRPIKVNFLILLIFSLAIFFAQTLNLKHDLEHPFHGSQESCSIYLTFNGSLDYDLYVVGSLDTFKDHFDILTYHSPFFFSYKPSFAIRAPPTNLQS